MQRKYNLRKNARRYNTSAYTSGWSGQSFDGSSSSNEEESGSDFVVDTPRSQGRRNRRKSCQSSSVENSDSHSVPRKRKKRSRRDSSASCSPQPCRTKKRRRTTLSSQIDPWETLEIPPETWKLFSRVKERTLCPILPDCSAQNRRHVHCLDSRCDVIHANGNCKEEIIKHAEQHGGYETFDLMFVVIYFMTAYWVLVLQKIRLCADKISSELAQYKNKHQAQPRNSTNISDIRSQVLQLERSKAEISSFTSNKLTKLSQKKTTSERFKVRLKSKASSARDKVAQNRSKKEDLCTKVCFSCIECLC